jgi:uncharacterized protein (DUF305 family)
MDTNNKGIYKIVFLAIGFIVGWLVWGRTPTDLPRHEAHMMPDMQMMMHDMNAALIGKTGDAFDEAFLREMIVHHEGAVQMAELALTSAKHQEIKDLAKAIISAQNTEIGQMNAWQSAWYGR